MDVVSLKNNCRKQDIPRYRKRFLKWESPALLSLLYLLSISISYSFLLFLSDLIILYSMVFTPSPNNSQIHDLHTHGSSSWSSFKENWFFLFQQLSIVNSSRVVLRVYLPSPLRDLFWLGFTQILHMWPHPLWVYTFSFLMCLEDTLSLRHSPPLSWTLFHSLLHNDPQASGGGGET